MTHVRVRFVLVEISSPPTRNVHPSVNKKIPRRPGQFVIESSGSDFKTFKRNFKMCRMCSDNTSNWSPRFCENAVFQANLELTYRDSNNVEVEATRYDRWSLAEEEKHLVSSVCSEASPSGRFPMTPTNYFVISKNAKILPELASEPIQGPPIPQNRSETNGHFVDPYRSNTAPFFNVAPIGLFHNSGPFPSNWYERYNLASTSSNNYPLSANMAEQDKLASTSSNNYPLSANMDQEDELASTSSNNYPLSANMDQQDELASTSSNNYPLSANMDQEDELASTSSNNYPLSANMDQQDELASTSSNNYPLSANMDQQDELASTSSNNYPLSANMDQQDELASTSSNNYPLSANMDQQDEWRGTYRFEAQDWDVSGDCEWSQCTNESCFSKITQFSEATKAKVIKQSPLEHTWASDDPKSIRQLGLLLKPNANRKEILSNIYVNSLFDNENLSGQQSDLNSSSVVRKAKVHKKDSFPPGFVKDDKKGQESPRDWTTHKDQAQNRNSCTSPCHQILNLTSRLFYCNECKLTISYFCCIVPREEVEEEILNPPLHSIEYYVKQMETEILHQPIDVVNLSQCISLKNTTIRSCSFCRTNSENKDFYKSHPLKDSNGKVLCPVLRLVKCPYCYATGDNAHTKRYCPFYKVLDEKVPTRRRLANGALANATHHK